MKKQAEPVAGIGFDIPGNWMIGCPFRDEKRNSGKGVAVHAIFVSPDDGRIEHRTSGSRYANPSNPLAKGGWPGQW
ncbi:MAG: hypothetical protein OXH27_02720 [Gammaproteobacteria bacterium]|nr:hypothetical protein [Gammaproteobacteria bacterium]MCY3690125.1 hypothetical protein [Gammaproteobacteria bacterium]MYA67466.1 hypothetical protein [Gammaproteobacteria bacterium]MYH46538.1 hypothetical protein [Gammaproteobacteria bacterium]MYL14778.1 hypothetical protein [Gammaproteobacteria bacterium]